MESLGNKLKDNRELKDISIEQVARETNISRQYIEALEKEAYDQFPGEPYLLGFLRNYSEYLGLDPNEQVQLYRNSQIQEQPVPMEELIPRKRRFESKYLLGVLFLILIGVGGYFLFGFLNQPVTGVETLPPQADPIEIEEPTQEELQGVVIPFEGNLEERLFLGDGVQVTEDSLLIVDSIGTNVGFLFGEEVYTLMLGQSVSLDEVHTLFVQDIDNSPGGQSVLVTLTEGDLKEEEPTQGGFAVTAEESIVVQTGNTQAQSRTQNTVLLYSNPEKEAFSIDIVFRDFCNFRYIVDGQDRTERYFQKGEKLRLDAYRSLMVWASNGGAIMAKLKGKEVIFGSNGEVSTKQIVWSSQTEEGNYNLELLPIY